MRAVPTLLMSLMLAYSFQPQVLAAASEPQLNFKIYSPDAANKSSTPAATDSTAPAADEKGAEQPQMDNASTPVDAKTDANSDAQNASDKSKDNSAAENKTDAASSEEKTQNDKDVSEKAPATNSADENAAIPSADAKTDSGTDTAETGEKGQKIASKVLQGYVRVVPTGTKVPIIMDTAVDSDTSQEGDEFSARTGEDLNIDGVTIVPAGSIIKGRIAQLNSPKRLNRSGSVALKFDTVTTPDNRQIPLVANIVARGGVVHARRGVKDIAIDCGVVAIPVAAGLGIGVIAGAVAKSSSIGPAGGALIGAGIGTALGVAILLAKKGKKIDVRPGDELKIELAEDLRMPMM